MAQEEYEAEMDAMGVGPLELDATDWILIATPGSKYAHAPNWTPWNGARDRNVEPACGKNLKVERYRVTNDDAEGKPPCPKCLRALRNHLRWLRSWTDSYSTLDWTDNDGGE